MVPGAPLWRGAVVSARALRRWWSRALVAASRGRPEEAGSAAMSSVGAIQLLLATATSSVSPSDDLVHSFRAADPFPALFPYEAPPPPPPGVSFNASFGNDMVLQQAPAKACVNGMMGAGGTGVTLTVATASGASYTVEAALRDSIGAFTPWKACLAPQSAGGGDEFTLTATCHGCTEGNATATLSRVLFGEVWYCGGQVRGLSPSSSSSSSSPLCVVMSPPPLGSPTWRCR
jgi:hypothetical protein